ncbi:MAG: PAS domain S-box protein [Nitrospirae bacterium]|nr:PAS domain S-box protein [Nitrospirota bacterium]
MGTISAKQHEQELEALLKSSRAVLKYSVFADAARAIFDSCKDAIGATAGYIALLSRDGTENEVLFLDAGGIPCTVDPSLPMPIRGLRERSYQTRTVVYENDFHSSKWMEFMPDGHVELSNVLFAPLIVEDRAVGLIGLANKPGGFTERDVQLAEMFGEHAAIALINSRTLEKLENSLTSIKIHEEQLSSIVETATDAIITINPNSKIVSWNKAAVNIFGYKTEEMIGLPLNIIIPERFQKRHHERLTEVVNGAHSTLIGNTIEIFAVNKDGMEFPIELSLSMWKKKEEIFFTGIIRDITSRKKAQEKIREQELDRIAMDRVAGINSLAAGIAHEINNPLGIISSSVGYVSKLTAKLSQAIGFWTDKDIPGPLKAQYEQLIAQLNIDQTTTSLNNKFDTIKRSITRIVNIVNSLRHIANLDMPDIEYVDVNKRLDEVIDVLNVESFRHIEFEKLYNTLPEIECSVGDINQCLLQIISNAIHAVGPMGKVVIRTAFNKEDGHINIEVRDYGHGMNKEVLQKAFHPFFTTKPVGTGTGIGLTITERIIKAHGGTIDIDSEEGKGTSVIIKLPVKRIT